MVANRGAVLPSGDDADVMYDVHQLKVTVELIYLGTFSTLDIGVSREV